MSHMQLRTLQRIVPAMATSDGAGVRLLRTLGGPMVGELDPFLLLDEFRSDNPSDYLAGFPDHPHRGFETVTYMLAGKMRHRDHCGNEGLLGPGSVQWMTAGRGIVHSEMPQQEQGLMWGFQLWVNLPAAQKMTAPRYQDIPRDKIPEVGFATHSRARIIAGRFGEVVGAVSGIATQPTYWDVHLGADDTLSARLEAGHNVCLYVYDGHLTMSTGSVPTRALAVLSAGDAVEIATDVGGARFLLLAGEPLNEPMVRYGPFVMNTDAEIRQAIEDYRRGTLGVYSRDSDARR